MTKSVDFFRNIKSKINLFFIYWDTPIYFTIFWDCMTFCPILVDVITRSYSYTGIIKMTTFMWNFNLAKTKTFRFGSVAAAM